MVRYFFVGGVAAIVDLTIFALLAKVFGFPYLGVAVLSFVIATGVNYELSIRHVFQSGANFSVRTEIGLTFLVSAVGLLVNQIVLWFLAEKAGADIVVAKLGATGAVFSGTLRRAQNSCSGSVREGCGRRTNRVPVRASHCCGYAGGATDRHSI